MLIEKKWDCIDYVNDGRNCFKVRQETLLTLTRGQAAMVGTRVRAVLPSDHFVSDFIRMKDNSDFPRLCSAAPIYHCPARRWAGCAACKSCGNSASGGMASNHWPGSCFTPVCKPLATAQDIRWIPVHQSLAASGERDRPGRLRRHSQAGSRVSCLVPQPTTSSAFTRCIDPWPK